MASGNIDEQDPLLAFNGLIDQEDSDADDASAMSLIDHLEELRWRIFKSLIAIAIGSILAFIFRNSIISFLAAPLPSGADVIGHGKIVVTGLTEGFTVYLLVSIATGIILALPVLLYQTWT